MGEKGIAQVSEASENSIKHLSTSILISECHKSHLDAVTLNKSKQLAK